MSAIEQCRSAALGGHVERCEDCGHSRIAYNSCRNRHCPKCQGMGELEGYSLAMPAGRKAATSDNRDLMQYVGVTGSCVTL
jgi:Transposase zinc-binding domain